MSGQSELSGLLVGVTPAAAEPTAPIAKRESPDLWSMLARKQLNLSERWRWLEIRVLDENAPRDLPREQVQSLVRGAEPTGEVFKSGPRKGQTNFKKVVPGSERTLVVSMADYDAFGAAWELETGCCADCGAPRNGPSAERCFRPSKHSRGVMP